MAERKWYHYSHPADMGVRGVGSTMADAFGQAAVAMTAVITDPDRIEKKVQVELSCRDGDPEMLFFKWLNEILYLMGTKNMLFGSFAYNYR